MRVIGKKQIKFTTGKVVDVPNEGIFGLSVFESYGEIYSGYDQEFERLYDDGPPGLSPTEKEEIARYMIARWTKWAREIRKNRAPGSD